MYLGMLRFFLSNSDKKGTILIRLMRLQSHHMVASFEAPVANGCLGLASLLPGSVLPGSWLFVGSELQSNFFYGLNKKACFGVQERKRQD